MPSPTIFGISATVIFIQNRYKSIVCDEDGYFKELVRYIHLNPLRAGLVKNPSGLDRYPWCGHSVVMGRREYPWQEREYVLSWFGRKEGEAKRAYNKYVQEGILDGKRPDLVGGGLIRSMGGWSEVLSLRRSQGRTLCDERILGSSDFVEKLIRDADERLKQRLSGEARRRKAKDLVWEFCERNGESVEELRAGSRRGGISQLRRKLVLNLVQELGVTLAEAGRQLGVSTSAVSKILNRERTSNST